MNWQQTIDWINGLAGRGELYADNLRAAIVVLNAVPIPRPGEIEERLGDWQWLLDTGNVLERPVVGGGGGVVQAGISSISPGMIAIGLLAAFLLFGRKKARD